MESLPLLPGYMFSSGDPTTQKLHPYLKECAMKNCRKKINGSLDSTSYSAVAEQIKYNDDIRQSKDYKLKQKLKFLNGFRVIRDNFNTDDFSRDAKFVEHTIFYHKKS